MAIKFQGNELDLMKKTIDKLIVHVKHVKFNAFYEQATAALHNSKTSRSSL